MKKYKNPFPQDENENIEHFERIEMLAKNNDFNSLQKDDKKFVLSVMSMADFDNLHFGFKNLETLFHEEVTPDIGIKERLSKELKKEPSFFKKIFSTQMPVYQAIAATLLALIAVTFLIRKEVEYIEKPVEVVTIVKDTIYIEKPIQSMDVQISQKTPPPRNNKKEIIRRPKTKNHKETDVVPLQENIAVTGQQKTKNSFDEIRSVNVIDIAALTKNSFKGVTMEDSKDLNVFFYTLE